MGKKGWTKKIVGKNIFDQKMFGKKILGQQSFWPKKSVGGEKITSISSPGKKNQFPGQKKSSPGKKKQFPGYFYKKIEIWLRNQM